jgi:hypothetical protein
MLLALWVRLRRIQFRHPAELSLTLPKRVIYELETDTRAHPFEWYLWMGTK